MSTASQLVLVDRAALVRLADLARRLCPDRRDPERFHIDRDAIERELRRLAGRSACASASGRSGG